MRKTVAIDFDGVIHEYSKGWQDGTVYDEIDIRGIKEAHARDYAVAVFTSRDVTQVANILSYYFVVVPDTTHALTFWDGGDDGRQVLVTNRKIAAVAYIDDRAVRHRYGDNWSATFETVRNLEGKQ